MNKIITALFMLVLFLFALISVFFIYKWLFPKLEDQLFLAIEKKCNNQSYCLVHLHEITHFRWDKAYFFDYNSDQDIQKITGVIGNFQSKDMLVLFTYRGKLTKYSFFNKFEDEDGKSPPAFLPPLFMSVMNIDMMFNVEKKTLYEMEYPGNLNFFRKNIHIRYYEITPQNDLLYASYVPTNYSSNFTEQYWLIFSNINQLHLFSSRKR